MSDTDRALKALCPLRRSKKQLYFSPRFLSALRLLKAFSEWFIGLDKLSLMYPACVCVHSSSKQGRRGEEAHVGAVFNNLQSIFNG